MTVAAAQSSFDVPDTKLAEEPSQRAGEGRGGIALHKDRIGSGFLESRFEARKRAGHDLSESLAVLHDVEVQVRRQVEYLADLFEHLTVLTGRQQERLELFAPAQLIVHGRELNRFRAGSEHHGYFGGYLSHTPRAITHSRPVIPYINRTVSRTERPLSRRRWCRCARSGLCIGRPVSKRVNIVLTES